MAGEDRLERLDHYRRAKLRGGRCDGWRRLWLCTHVTEVDKLLEGEEGEEEPPGGGEEGPRLRNLSRLVVIVRFGVRL